LAYPKSIDDVRSFHGLASFYRQLIRNFSLIMGLMTEVIKGSSFQWNPNAEAALVEINTMFTEALVLGFLVFTRYLKWNVLHLEWK